MNTMNVSSNEGLTQKSGVLIHLNNSLARKNSQAPPLSNRSNSNG